MSSLSSSSTVKGLFMLGNTTSVICSGGLLFTSYMHVPGYLKSSSDDSLLLQWQTMGAIGARTVPPLTLLASGANFLASYLSPTRSQRYRFIAAGVLSLSILPYTFVALASTNAELGAREGKKENTLDAGLRSLDIRELIQRWSDRSAVRGFLLLASTIMGYDAILQLTS